MKSFLSNSFLILLASFLTLGAVQAQVLGFEAAERPERGTAFFTMDKRTGQVYYMLDHHDNAGKWKKYGPQIGDLPGGGFLFRSNERENGTAFFAMESVSGQLYYMLDYGDTPGVWRKYGDPIGKAGYTFDATEREGKGTAFFAVESTTGQLYYMLDHGPDAGVWSFYGEPLPK